MYSHEQFLGGHGVTGQASHVLATATYSNLLVKLELADCRSSICRDLLTSAGHAPVLSPTDSTQPDKSCPLIHSPQSLYAIQLPCRSICLFPR